jgi:hypothetical protein
MGYPRKEGNELLDLNFHKTNEKTKNILVVANTLEGREKKRFDRWKKMTGFEKKKKRSNDY